MNYKKVLTYRLLNELNKFYQMNYHDPLVVTGINATALIILADMQDSDENFDGDVDFDYDPEPMLRVFWWIGSDRRNGSEIRIRFDPLRVEQDIKELADAYDRAMRVL
jgi:hypothetical protein